MPEMGLVTTVLAGDQRVQVVRLHDGDYALDVSAGWSGRCRVKLDAIHLEELATALRSELDSLPDDSKRGS